MSVERKVALIGYTDSKQDAPWTDPTWEKWGINNLHNWVPIEHCTRWYDLHPYDDVIKDSKHVDWLRTTALPVYMWDTHDEFPSSQRFPKEEVLGRFGKYFTNSISWMIAHALLEGVSEIGIWGVDMAQGTEYAAQRPSCEYFIGLAIGMGVRVQIAEKSDLCKTAYLYGADGGGDQLRLKLEARDEELKRRLHEAREQHESAEAMIHQLNGALEQNRYILGVWLQPNAKRDDNSSHHVEV